MAFSFVEKGVAKAAFQRRFELAQTLRVEPDVAGREFCKAFEIGAVAGMRHHQRAVERGFGKMLTPEIERADAEPGDQGFRGFGLAPGRQHAPSFRADKDFDWGDRAQQAELHRYYGM